MELKVGATIKRLRMERGIKQEEPAEYLGVSFQAVSEWETNTTTPDIALLPKLAVFFGVSTDELFAINDGDHFKRIDIMLRDEYMISAEKFTQTERYLKGLLNENSDNLEAIKIKLLNKSQRVLFVWPKPYNLKTLVFQKGKLSSGPNVKSQS